MRSDEWTELSRVLTLGHESVHEQVLYLVRHKVGLFGRRYSAVVGRVVAQQPLAHLTHALRLPHHVVDGSQILTQPTLCYNTGRKEIKQQDLTTDRSPVKQFQLCNFAVNNFHQQWPVFIMKYIKDLLVVNKKNLH